MNNTTPTPQKQECPYFPELLETQKLRRKLEQEHKLRKEAEAQNIFRFIVGCLVSFVFTLVIMQVLISVSINAEIAATYASLTYACAALFFSLGLAMGTLDSVLNGHAKRKQEKNDAKKKEV